MTVRQCLGRVVWVVGAGAGMAVAAPAATLDDRAVFALYDQVNGFDVETASLGAVQGHDPAVRELAVMVLRDHSAVRQMSRDLGARLGIAYTVPEQDEASRGHAQALARLRGKRGVAFDRAYLAHEVEFHRAAIKAVRETLVPGVTSPELKKLLLDVLPGFEQHLSHTVELAHRFGVTLKE